MYFKNILGNNTVKNSLLKEFLSNRLPHAQLFYGGDLSQQLPMALAFATYLFCEDKNARDSCGKCVNCAKMFKLTHPDLHFFYPTIKNPKTKEKISESKSYFPEFQKALLDNPNLSQDEWIKNLKSSKNASIRTADLNELCKISNLRSYQGGYKIFIIWGAETIIKKSSSILLKTIEEPPEKTVFIFICNNRNSLLATIKSRLQEKKFNAIEPDILMKFFQQEYPDLTPELITSLIKSNPQSYTKIKKSLDESSHESEIVNDFVEWIRLCFLSINKSAKYHDESVALKIVDWCNNISKLDKHYQVQFLKIATRIFRSSFLLNYSTQTNANMEHSDFNPIKFSKYVQHYNIIEIFSLLSSAHYYLSRYANSKIIFLDLSFTLGRILHQNPQD